MKSIVKYKIIICRRVAYRKKFDEKIDKELKRDLEELCQVFDQVPCEVFLTGGVGLAARLKKFYRNHKDFDVAVFASDLPILDNYLKSKGGQVMRRIFMSHLSPWHDIHIFTPFSPEELKKYPPGTAKIRGYLPRKWMRYIKHRHEAFDIFLWEKEGDQFKPVGYDWNIPIASLYPANPLNERTRLLLPSMEHKKYLPPKTIRQLPDNERFKIKPVKEIELDSKFK